VRTLSPSVITPEGFIDVFPTLQIADGELPKVFAAGDIANTRNQKAAKQGVQEGYVVAYNIMQLASGNNKLQAYKKMRREIHMSLGLVSAH